MFKGSRVMSRNLSITSTRVEKMKTSSEQVLLRFLDVPFSGYGQEAHFRPGRSKLSSFLCQTRGWFSAASAD
jgi:hypothetical protein